MNISIIIPTYNCVQFLSKAIESVLSQPLVHKEVIVVDGNSKDGTVDLLRSYENKIRWISEPDNGQADAINKGFKMAQGEIVAWLNADDYYEGNILNDIVDAFSLQEDIVMVYGNCKSSSKEKNVLNIPPQHITSKDLIVKGNFIFQPSSFYKKEVVKKVGYLDDTLEYWMEYDLYIKLLHQGRAHYINKLFAHFTVREDQKSNSKNLLKMDKELLAISAKYGAPYLSKIRLRYWRHVLERIIFIQ